MSGVGYCKVALIPVLLPKPCLILNNESFAERQSSRQKNDRCLLFPEKPLAQSRGERIKYEIDGLLRPVHWGGHTGKSKDRRVTRRLPAALLSGGHRFLLLFTNQVLASTSGPVSPSSSVPACLSGQNNGTGTSPRPLKAHDRCCCNCQKKQSEGTDCWIFLVGRILFGFSFCMDRF